MYSRRCFQPIDQTRILIGIVMQESASFCDQPGIRLYVLGIQVTRHEDGMTAAKAGRQVQSKLRARRVTGKHQDFHRFTGQQDLNSSSLQVL